jgi:hypothetical protein
MWKPERERGSHGATILRPTDSLTPFCSPNPPPIGYMSYWPLLPKSVQATWGRASKSNWLGTVSSTLRFVGKTFQLAGHSDPRTIPGSKELHLALSRLYSTYKHTDPATESQIALPVAIFANIMANEGVSRLPNVQATADLTIIAFCFLLRVGEYTQPTSGRPTRTTQFRLKVGVIKQTEPTSGSHLMHQPMTFCSPRPSP